jgi:hypothetical protein
MDETFRLPRSLRNMAIGSILGFLAWFTIDLFVVLDKLDGPHPILLAALLLGVPLIMVGTSALLLATYYRSELTIVDDLVTSRGLFIERSLDLRDVTEARWQVAPNWGSLSFRSGSKRLALHFGTYAIEDRERMVHYLRSRLPAEIQVGWNLYAYKVKPFDRQTTPAKPGPDEILLRRDRWDRYFVPTLVVSSLVGFVVWRITGELKPSIAFPLVLLGLLIFLRFSTPAEGIVAQKLSASFSPDHAHFFRFALLWGLVGLAGLLVNGYFRPGMKDLDAILIVGGVAWCAVFFHEVYLLDRREARRDREAADLAAKARGEPADDHWSAD